MSLGGTFVLTSITTILQFVSAYSVAQDIVQSLSFYLLLTNILVFTSLAFYLKLCQSVSLGGTFLVTGGGDATMETDEVKNLFQFFIFSM